MNEVFDSQQMNVEYRKDDGIVIVVLKGKVLRDEFRTPMMHAADMVLRHSCKALAVDICEDLDLDEIDVNWCKKVYLPNLKESGVETLIFIDGNKQASVRKYKEFLDDKFKTVICKDYEEAKLAVKPSDESPETAEEDGFASMTRDEALKYMGLEKDADVKEIEDRFWQMSKKYRGKDDPESKKMEDEISAIYDIASGRRDRRLEEEKREASESKVFGYSKTWWKNFFHYNWKNIILGIVLAVSVTLVAIGIVKGSGTDCSVVVYGNMFFDNTTMREALMANGLKKPYVGFADLVVPNNEGFAQVEYGTETLNALFYTNPDVMISDSRSYPYFFMTYKDLTPLYDRIMAGLSEEAKAGVKPVYMSERDSVICQNEQLMKTGLGDEELADPSMYPNDPIMIGIEVTDPALAAKLGADPKWKSHETTFVYGWCTNSKDEEQTILIITTLINAAYEL